MSRLGFGQGTSCSTSIITSSRATGHCYHLLHEGSRLCPSGGPGSYLLVGHLCRGGWACSLCLPFSTFILLEKELHRRRCRGRGWLLWGSPGPFSFTGFILIFLPFLDCRGLPSGRGSRAPPRFPSWALGSLAAAGIRRQMGGQWMVDMVGGLAVVFKVFLPIASAWLLSSSGSSLLQDLLEPFYTEGTKFVFFLLREPRCSGAQAFRLWRVQRICARGRAPGGAAHGQILALFAVASAFRATRWRHNPLALDFVSRGSPGLP